MPLYVYEAKEGGCGRCRDGFEISQSIKDDKLKVIKKNKNTLKDILVTQTA